MLCCTKISSMAVWAKIGLDIVNLYLKQQQNVTVFCLTTQAAERRCERKPVWVLWEHLWPTPAAHTSSNYLAHGFRHLRRLLWWAVTVLQNLNILTNDACNGLRTSGISPIVCIPQSSAHPGTYPTSTRFVLYHNQRFSWPYFRPIFKPVMRHGRLANL